MPQRAQPAGRGRPSTSTTWGPRRALRASYCRGEESACGPELAWRRERQGTETQPIDQLRGNQGDQMQNQERKQKRDVYGALLFMGDLQGRRGAQWLTAPGESGGWVVVVSRDLIHQLQHG